MALTTVANKQLSDQIWELSIAVIQSRIVDIRNQDLG